MCTAAADVCVIKRTHSTSAFVLLENAQPAADISRHSVFSAYPGRVSKLLSQTLFEIRKGLGFRKLYCDLKLFPLALEDDALDHPPLCRDVFLMLSWLAARSRNHTRYQTQEHGSSRRSCWLCPTHWETSWRAYQELSSQPRFNLFALSIFAPGPDVLERRSQESFHASFAGWPAMFCRPAEIERVQ